MHTHTHTHTRLSRLSGCLHIVNGSELNLTSAVGDMANGMILSALIAPNKDGSRNLICNIWVRRRGEQRTRGVESRIVILVV